MTPIRRFGAVDIALFLFVVFLAGGVRAGYLMLSADNGRSAGPLVVQDPADEKDLQALAHSLRDDNSFRSVAPLAAGAEETAHASPGYPFLLGQLGRMIPAEDQLRLSVRWIQCGLGALTAGFYFLFARRAFRSLAAGVLAGMLCALNPFWVVNTAQIDDGVVVSFLVGMTLFVGARAGQMGGPFASLLYGLGLAASALVRAALLPFAFVGLAWFLLRTRRLPSGWLGALLSFLGFIIGVAPWAVRNWQAFGEPVAIVDSAYLHIWMGNNSQANGGPVDPERALPSDQVSDLKADAKQPERYGRLGPVVWDEMRRDPAAVPQHRLQAALAYYFGSAPTSQPRDRPDAQPGPEVSPSRIPVVAQAAENPNGPSALASYEALFLWSLLGMIVLGLLGWRWSYGWRAESMPAALAMVWIPLPYILSHADALSSSRLPLDGVLMCYAAFALLCLTPGIRRHFVAGAAAANPPPR